MIRIREISIIASFLGLWARSFLTEKLEYLLGFFLIFTFGMLHGANDLLLLNEFPSQRKKSLIRKLIHYLVSTFLVAVFFYFFPSIALLGFLGYSAYHFGEQHWHAQIQKHQGSATFLLYFFYGMCLLCLLFLHNETEVKNIVLEITKKPLDHLYTLPLLLIFSAGGLSCFFFLKNAKQLTAKQGLKELFFLGLLTILFKASSLIWGFAIYFIFWHSIPSLFDQVTFLYGNTGSKNILKYAKKAFPYWLVAVLAVFILYHFLSDERQLSTLFFCFVAAVTFPHALVMHKMFRLHK